MLDLLLLRQSHIHQIRALKSKNVMLERRLHRAQIEAWRCEKVQLELEEKKTELEIELDRREADQYKSERIELNNRIQKMKQSWQTWVEKRQAIKESLKRIKYLHGLELGKRKLYDDLRRFKSKVRELRRGFHCSRKGYHNQIFPMDTARQTQ